MENEKINTEEIERIESEIEKAMDGGTYKEVMQLKADLRKAKAHDVLGEVYRSMKTRTTKVFYDTKVPKAERQRQIKEILEESAQKLA